MRGSAGQRHAASPGFTLRVGDGPWSRGRETAIEDMAAFQKSFPGGRFDVGDVSAHHDLALLTWVLVQADGKVFARGHDQIRIAPDGKIASIITFAPSVTSP